ncbi:MAG: phosphate ABC transporter substrate-binding protein [Kordiimonadales bacterium]|nr:MAG: phosphate ABC transporter substrate-binding protein [Kordiimonadales bacterium]
MSLKLVALSLALAAPNAASYAADKQIRVVGSSTVYPFSTVVAERFGRTTKYRTPIVESTGTGGGFKLFCAGTGTDTPSVSNASRAIKSSEVKLCAKNGVATIIEVKVGYDGIVMANARQSAQFALSTRDIFLALADKIPGPDGTLVKNTNRTWKDVNRALPNAKIEVLGPPPTSGTRDAFVELAMEAGCKSFADIKALKKTNKKKYKQICHSIREDSAFIEAGENDNLIVQRLRANPDALGIFGFSFLDQNSDTVKAATINGVAATFSNISDGSYPISRPLFFYAKAEHVGKMPGLSEFVTEFISDKASGEEGYLSERGLIPMSASERQDLNGKVRLALSK